MNIHTDTHSNKIQLKTNLHTKLHTNHWNQKEKTKGKKSLHNGVRATTNPRSLSDQRGTKSEERSEEGKRKREMEKRGREREREIEK